MLRFFVDNRIGGSPRYYVAEKSEHDMIVPDAIRKCVLFVGYEKSDGVVVKVGTAFLVSVPAARSGRHYVYAVTAKHVIAKIKSKGLNAVYLRFNTLEQAYWLHTPIDAWLSHPDDYTLDACACMWALPGEFADYKLIPHTMTLTPEIIASYEIGVGEDVFLTGLFSKHTGKKKAVPIVRTGTIALMPDPNELVEVRILGVRYEIEAYLIEARSIGGLSGSPVFVNLGHVWHKNSKPRDGEFYWLGLMHGHWDVDVEPDEYEEDDDAVPIQEKVNMGIAIVIPSYKIMEVINQPFFADMRKQFDDAERVKDLPTPDEGSPETNDT